MGNIQVITTTREPISAIRVPAAVHVITQEDIRRSGATSIPEVLQLVPGVQVGRIDSNKWSIGIRGFQGRLSRSVLVLIDGRSVYTPLFAGVYWEVQDTLLEDIDRIEVIRGPGATIWGANAVNGVINVITKSSKDTHGTLVSLAGGNVDQGLFDFRHGGGDGNRFNYRVYGKGFTRGPQFHGNGSSFDDWRMAQGGFRSDWDMSSGESLTVQGDIYNGAIGERIALATYTPPFSFSVDQNSEVAGGNILTRWQRRVGIASDLQVQVYYDRTSRSQANFEEIRDTLDLDFIHHSTAGTHQLAWGAGTRISVGRSKDVVPTVSFVPNRFTTRLFNGFVQDDFSFAGNRFRLMFGSKFLHDTYSGVEAQPTARLSFTPSETQTVWTAFTRALRTPSRVEADLRLDGLVSRSPLTFARYQGDRSFSSEELLGYEAGYRNLLMPNLRLRIAVYHNKYDDLLSIEPDTPFQEATPTASYRVLPFTFGNGIGGSTSGMEISPEWTPATPWRVGLSYSYLNIDMQRGPGSKDASSAASLEGSSPRHSVVVRSQLDLPGRFELDQTYRFVSGLRAQQQVPSYQTADVRLGWRPVSSFELSVTGKHLLQPHHAEYGGGAAGIVEIKRAVLGKLTFRW